MRREARCWSAAQPVSTGARQQDADLHPREATGPLSDLVREASGVLADDAALLMLDGQGDHGRPRRIVAVPTPELPAPSGR